MIASINALLHEWLDDFLYPVFLIADNSSILYRNDMAKNRFSLGEGKEEFLEDCFPDEATYRDFRDFLGKLARNERWMESSVQLAGEDVRPIVAKAIEDGATYYYLLILVPYRFGPKFRTLKQKYDAIMMHVSDSIIVTDKQERIIETNKGFERVTGFSFEEVVGRYPTILKSGKQSKEFYSKMYAQIAEQGFFHGNIVDRKKSGALLHGELTIVAIKGNDGSVENYMGILKDTTELEELRASLQRTHNKDPLTGVQNRSSFLQVLNIKTSLATSKNSLALLFIDLNKFKQVNDTYGHIYGDYVLKIAAKRIQNTLRANDLVGRYGGDEFLVMLERVDEVSAYKLAKKIEEALSLPYIVEEQVIDFVSGSIGVAFAPRDANNAQELISKTDESMYAAKKSREGEHVKFYGHMQHESSSQKLKMELLGAFENEEFYLRIHPLVHTHTGQIVGGEALARWLNLTFDEVSPATFLPMIERFGLLKRFDHYILNAAIELLDQYKDLPQNFFLDINFSAEQFADIHFIELLENLLAQRPWINRYIVIEILESTVMYDIERSSQHLQQIKELGFKIAIDDFGTGFSSLAYLKHFTIDYIKIDKSFIDDIESSSKDREIVETIVMLAKAIGAKTVAEGVECKKQLEIVKEIGIDYTQGFYFYKPLLIDSFFQKLKLGK